MIDAHGNSKIDTSRNVAKLALKERGEIENWLWETGQIERVVVFLSGAGHGLFAGQEDAPRAGLAWGLMVKQ